MRDRLADRDLEIKILQKRMNLRRSSSSDDNGAQKIVGSSSSSSSSCQKCREKDGLVSDLYQKLRNLENIVEAFCSIDEKAPTTRSLSQNKSSIPDAELEQVQAHSINRAALVNYRREESRIIFWENIIRLNHAPTPIKNLVF